MGQMRFVPPPGERISADDWSQAYVAGLEGIPYPTSCIQTQNVYVVTRDINESGSLFVPYEVDGIGKLMLSTTSLMESAQPYLLQLELARGTLNRLRNQAVDWEMAGLKIAADLQAKIRHSAGVFSRAVTVRETDVEQCLELSANAIRMACMAIERLGEEYGRQALAYRHQQSRTLSTLLGCDLGMSAPYEDDTATAVRGAFNSISIPVSWKQIEPDAGEYDWSSLDRQVEWCERQKIRAISLGPIFDPRKELLPDWIYLWEDDFDQLQSSISQFLQHVVLRYKGRILLWHCATGLNLPEALSINEEQRLRLAVRSVEAIRQIDSQTPVVISFLEPFGEYMTNPNIDLSPMHFADALVRAELGLAGLGLDLRFGHPGGPPARDALEVSQLIDRWSLLGLPLMLTVDVVGGASRDGTSPALQFTDPESQAVQAQRVLPILLAKQAVHGVIWGQLDDRQPHQPNAAGLFDGYGSPKPVLETLAELRREHLA